MFLVKEVRAVVEMINGVHQCILGVLENYSGGVMLSSHLVTSMGDLGVCRGSFSCSVIPGADSRNLERGLCILFCICGIYDGLMRGF